ncbi:MAG: thymidylate synthase [Desulfobaccales bacterium]
MEFKALHFADRLTIINPQGSIGVVTLWSKPDYVIERFREAGVDLNPATSPIAVFGTLYGNGLREMLRNLLYNPQIQTLLICGNDRSGSRREIRNFFAYGLEPLELSLVSYRSHSTGTKIAPARICKTNRIIDDLVKPETFAQKPKLIALMDPSEPDSFNEIKYFFETFESEPLSEGKRIKILLPEVEVPYFPGNPRGHVVVRDTITEAWKEVLYLLTRFGHRVSLKKGDRLELQHVKVVVEKPEFEADKKLHEVNLDSQKLRRYQADILRGELRPDETYNYGHRMRAYFGLDTLAACADRLKADPEDRKSYVALWDTTRDLTVKEGHPCLVSLYFRKFEGKLTLSATFRTHNAMDAYPMNLYGLMAIQAWVAERVGPPPGAIVVISHSLGLDPKELDRAMPIIGQRPFKVRLDPMGYFRITLDGKEILVEHRFEDVTLKEYRGKKAVSLQHQIARDVALSDINHAIYLGRQLAKAEMALKDGREFVQD